MGVKRQIIGLCGCALWVLSGSLPAMANPSGGQVVAGSAAIAQPNSTKTQFSVCSPEKM